MILGIKNHFREYYIPKGCRKEREHVLFTMEDAEIKEPSEAEFPVAFIVKEYGSVYNPEKNDTDFILHDIPVRTCNGKLYKPYVDPSGHYTGRPYTLTDLCAHISGHYAYDQYIYKGKDYIPFDEKTSKVVSDTRADQVEDIKTRASEFLYFGNAIWEECNEPRYCIYTFGLGHNHGGTSLSIDWYYNDNISHERYFSALQREEAIRYAKETALGRGDTDYVERIGKDENIQVLMPEMIKVNPPQQHGDGDPFLNSLYGITKKADSAQEAGILAMLFTAAEVAG